MNKELFEKYYKFEIKSELKIMLIHFLYVHLSQ